MLRKHEELCHIVHKDQLIRGRSDPLHRGCEESQTSNWSRIQAKERWEINHFKSRYLFKIILP